MTKSWMEETEKGPKKALEWPHKALEGLVKFEGLVKSPTILKRWC